MKSFVPFLAISSALFSSSLSAPLPMGSLGDIVLTDTDNAQIPVRASHFDADSGNVAGKPFFVKRSLNSVSQLSTVDQASSDGDSFTSSHALIPAATERLQKRTMEALLALEETAFAQQLAKWMHFSPTFPVDAPPLIQEKWALHQEKVLQRMKAMQSGGIEELPPKDYIHLTAEEIQTVRNQIREIRDRKAAAAAAANPSSSVPSGSSPTARGGTSWLDSVIDFFTDPPRISNAGIARNSNPEG